MNACSCQKLAAACIPWPGAVTHDGYARSPRTINGTRYVHVQVYEAAHGPVPAGYQLDHTCHTADDGCTAGDQCPHRRCINVDHLELVTPRENALRGRSIWALNARKTHCAYGHPFDETNTILSSKGRGCRACANRRSRELRSRRSTGRTPGGQARALCSKGHPLVDGNLKFFKRSDGSVGRRCLTCVAQRRRRVA